MALNQCRGRILISGVLLCIKMEIIETTKMQEDSIDDYAIDGGPGEV